MSEPAVRVAVVAVLALSALLLAWLARRAHRGSRNRVDVSQLIPGPGVVVFTKDDCSNCAAVLALVEESTLPVKQVQAETEPELFDQLGVVGVPLTVVVGDHGRQVAQFEGLPAARSLRRALRKGSEIPSRGGSGL